MRARNEDLQKILDIVYEVTGISANDIKSSSRLSEIAQARQLYCYLARKLTGKNYHFIGRYINRDRTVVMKSIQKIQGFLDIKDSTITHFFNECTKRAQI